ncbi:MAG: hypothetical protein K8J08_16895, partial [Thermoanaerobaculia bacterium]|nr:hypothetical protein [Thermoanaerobaculia bacterium]
FKEFFAIVGRGGGKSRIAAFLAVLFSCGRDYEAAPGEAIYVGIFAPDRKQAAVTLKYVRGLIRSVPALERLIVGETKDSITLSNGVVVEVLTASSAAPRGRSYALAIVEEAAFLPSGDSRDPDKELLRALRPALARVPGSMLVVISSPYARTGELYEAHRKHFGRDDSDHTLVIQAPTSILNPAFDPQEIARAYAEDPESAKAEYGAEFRTDVASFVSRDAIDAALVPGRVALPPLSREQYRAFLDFAGGSGKDSATLAIAHAEDRTGTRVFVLDHVSEVRPPFSPAAVCEQFAMTLGLYRLKEAVADRYAGDFPVESMSSHGVKVTSSDMTKSEIYAGFLPLLNSGSVELLDSSRLITQLSELERRTTRGSGRESIDHAPGSHDDVINAAAGALLLASKKRRYYKATWGRG